MASLWLLSTVGTVGVLVTQGLKLMELPREAVVLIVAAAECIGIALLWVVALPVQVSGLTFRHRTLSMFPKRAA